MIKKIITFVQNQFHRGVKVIRIENAFELGSSHEGTTFLQSMGIVHQKSTPRTPQQNGLLERKHRHILEVARSLYFQYSLCNTY